MTKKYKWFSCVAERDNSAYNFFCFPHAGAGATFYASWVKSVPEKYSFFPVLYPMRENRRNEVMPSSIQELAKTIAVENIDLFRKKPCILFGHCFGAIVAYETALLLKKENCPTTLLIASGSGAPRNGNTEFSLKDAQTAEIADMFISMGYLDHASKSNKIYLDFFMPVLKTDHLLLEDYIPSNEKCGCPIYGIYGRDDCNTSADDVEKWSDFTGCSFSSKSYNGNHFFLDDENIGILFEEIDKQL